MANRNTAVLMNNSVKEITVSIHLSVSPTLKLKNSVNKYVTGDNRIKKKDKHSKIKTMANPNHCPKLLRIIEKVSSKALTGWAL